MKTNVTLSCCMCIEKVEFQIDTPDNWKLRTEIYEEDCFCSKHFAIEEFADNQCSGCVGGWMDCNLWRAFAYNKPSLTEMDFEHIERGICPKRTNGTFMVKSSSEGVNVSDINLSEMSSTESGMALATAIRDYIEKYKEVQ